MALASILLIIASMYLSSVYSHSKQRLNLPLYKDLKRETPCDDSVGCDFICLPLHCKHEIFEVEKKTLSKADMHSTLEVDCERPLSCIGMIKIDVGASKYISTIYCGVEDNACLGGLYQFNNMRQAEIWGNVRESIITFKDIAIAEIFIDEHDQKPMMFFLNNIFTEKVFYFVVNALAPHSMTASVINLGGVTGNVRFNCFGEGSCAGSIILLKKCGHKVTIICGKGQNVACDDLVIIVRLDPSCKDADGVRTIEIQHVALAGDEAPAADRHPIIYVWCEHKHPGRTETHYQCASTPSRIISLKEFKTKSNFVATITQDLKELDKKWDGEHKSKMTNNLKYMLDIPLHGHTNYYGGVALEAAWGTLAVGGLTEITKKGVKAAKVIASGIGPVGAALASGIATPLAPVFIVPFVLYTGLEGYNYYQKRKAEKKWGIEAVIGLKETAREQMVNFYDYDQHYYSDLDNDGLYLISMGFELEDKGNIVYRDIFTGERKHSDDKHEQSVAIGFHGHDNQIKKRSVYDGLNNHSIRPPQYFISTSVLNEYLAIIILCIAAFGLCFCVHAIYCCVFIGGYYIFARKQKKEVLYIK